MAGQSPCRIGLFAQEFANALEASSRRPRWAFGTKNDAVWSFSARDEACAPDAADAPVSVTWTHGVRVSDSQIETNVVAPPNQPRVARFTTTDVVLHTMKDDVPAALGVHGRG